MNQPYSQEAEESVIGSVLIDPSALETINLPSEAFFIVKNRWIWEAIFGLRKDGLEIDILTVANRLNSHLDEVGGHAYLLSLIASVPTSIHARSYSEIVRKSWVRRKRLALASDIARSAVEDEDPDTRTAEFAERLIDSSSTGMSSRPIAQVSSEFYDLAAERRDNPREFPGLRTGMRDFDRASGGLRLKETLILSGEPGMGKSLLAIQWAMTVAESGIGVAIYELEMSLEKIMERASSARAHIQTDSIQTGNLSDREWDSFVQAIDRIHGLPVYLSDSTRWTVADIRADIIRKNATGSTKIQLVVVDYLKLLKDQFGQSEHERESYISTGLRDCFKDTGVAGVVVHSMNKAGIASHVKDKEHLAGGAQIPFDADTILFIDKHSPANGAPVQRSLRTLFWSKNRGNETPAPIHIVKLPGFPAFGDISHDEPKNPNGTHGGTNGARVRREMEYLNS